MFHPPHSARKLPLHPGWTVLLVAVLGAGPGCGSPAEAPSSAQVAAETRTATLKVDGMTCASCETSIRIAATKVDGVVSADVSYDASSATVVYDPARTSPEAIAAVVTNLGYPTTVARTASTPPSALASEAAAAPTGVDPEMAAICEAGCAAEEGYAASDVVTQPGAKVGDLTRCPVSGVVFRVKADQPKLERAGQTWFTCCGMCMGKLTENPARFVGS